MVQEKPQPHKGLQIPLSVSVKSTHQVPVICIPLFQLRFTFAILGKCQRGHEFEVGYGVLPAL